MIESIGYTNDGMVWMNVAVEHQGQRGTMVVTMTQDQAREISHDLITAADEAGEKNRVRDSSNTH